MNKGLKRIDSTYPRSTL